MLRSAHQSQMSRVKSDRTANLIELMRLIYERAVELSTLRRMLESVR